MSSLVSIRINEALLKSMRQHAHQLHLSQTEYIRKAIELLNREVDKQERKKRMEEASMRVRDNSMRVNAEFSEIDHDPED
jgi:Arc/MetJ-type ribon-helix-helix transcriptional regulator